LPEPTDKSPPRSKPLLVTVPGARSRSAWQDAVQRVFGPHFRCEKYLYSDYDRALGRLAIVADPWWLAAATAALMAAFLVRWPVDLYPWPEYLLPVCSIACGALAIHRARIRRVDCAHRLGDWISKLGSKPSVVADSFGSYLVGTALRDRAEVKVRNLVLASTPLPRNYPWVPIVPRRAARVRSEISRRDISTSVLYVVRWFAEDLGDAGSRGFDDTRAVHSTFPDGQCAECTVTPPPAPVHNVRLRTRRGAHLSSEAYLQQYWLPFFWNIPIPEFEDLTELAGRVCEFGQTQKYDEADREIDVFLTSKFSWTGGRTVEQWILSAIATYIAEEKVRCDPDKVFDYVTQRLLALIATAKSESGKPTERDEDVVICLQPWVALMKLVVEGVGGP
jgi:hypothetical protein